MSSEKSSFGGENEVFPQPSKSNLPLTNSMITVRLSEAMFDFPAAELAYEPVGDGLTGLGMPLLERKQEPTKEAESTKSLEPHSFQSLDDLKETSLEIRDSMAARSRVEEDTSRTTSDIFRSRSNSSGTSSSVASAHVDWDELDRSEEQAPRDECSDEVCTK